jgi:hypothetical protein
MLARMLVRLRRYEAEEARKAYLFWFHSAPFDCGGTVSCEPLPNRDALWADPKRTASLVVLGIR